MQLRYMGRMPIYDIYSRRKRRAEGGDPDVYQYRRVSPQLRTQVCFILESALGFYQISTGAGGYVYNNVWSFINDTLKREKELPYLWRERADPMEDCLEAVKNLDDVDDWLDVVEFCFRIIPAARPDDRRRYEIEQEPDDAINELNFRFREAGLGCQFETGQIIRVDETLLHSEVTKPALMLLSDPRFKGAQDEFLSAHAHYRAGEHEDAIVDANRAFESTLKTICDVKAWPYGAGARASDLFKVIRGNGLLPDYLDQSFDQLMASMKSGLPQVRNNAGGHGQGAVPRHTPGYIAGYAMHLAAANIVLLVNALKESE